MVDAVEEFPYVALERIARSCAVLAHRTKRSCQMFDTLVRALADAAREGSRGECRFENRIKNFKYRMVQDSIAYGRFVYATEFRIVNHEHPVLPMTVPLLTQFAAESA